MGLISPAVSKLLLACSANLFSSRGAFADPDTSPVRVNQIGYLPLGTKIGVIVDSSTSPIDFQVQDSSGSAVFSGTTSVYGNDEASADYVHHADFTQLGAVGLYKLVVVGGDESVLFEIAPTLYPNLPHEAMNYFYFHRMGTAGVEGEYLVDDRYERAALHPGDDAIPVYSNWCNGCSDFDVLGSWADAGDFGIYSVNHAISAWTLLNLLEMFPSAFGDSTLNIPESGNTFPDILDEADYGSQFMKGMLPSDTSKLASHKVHNHDWSAFDGFNINTENSSPRSAMGPSTAATLAVARNCAHLARMWNTHGGTSSTTKVDSLWNAAKDAWGRGKDTSVAFAGPDANGGGDYPDGNLDDDKYAAAVEMYLTATKLEKDATEYKSRMTSSSFFTQMRQWDWASVDGAATLSLYAFIANNSAGHGLTTQQVANIENNIKSFADDILSAFDNEGYPANCDFPNCPGAQSGKYPWGSNSFLMNRAIALAFAYEITSEQRYAQGILRTMDYMMGVNAMRISYVTGYGDFAETDTHDRWAWAVGSSAFWPPGWLSGGPNNDNTGGDPVTPTNNPAAKAYAAPGTAPQAWGSKENTVNWNAPLAWVAWYIENKISPLLGGCGGNCPPVAYGQDIAVEVDTTISITLSAFDFEGGVLTWSHTDPSLGTLSGTAPNLSYQAPSTIGTTSFTFTVTDDQGDSDSAVITITVRECNFFNKYGVPSSATLPTGYIEYNYAHVSEDGPSLSGFQRHTSNVGESDLYEFSMHTVGPPHYLDLRTCMSNNNLFGGSSIGFTLSGCPIPGIDGDYYVNKVGNDEVWVEVTGLWAIVFSNDPAAPEFCVTSTSTTGTTSTSATTTTSTTTPTTSTTTTTTTATPTTTSTTTTTTSTIPTTTTTSTTTTTPTTTTTTTATPSTSTTTTSTLQTTTTTTPAPTTTTSTGTTTSGACNLLTRFNMPRSNAFTSPYRQYTYVFVSDGGPALNNMQEHITHVDNSNTHQFSIRTKNGTPDWYVDLKNCMTVNTFQQSNPGFTLSGCGFAGLDNDYYIDRVGNDEVWVEKTGAYAIYFSKQDTAPTFCT